MDPPECKLCEQKHWMYVTCPGVRAALARNLAPAAAPPVAVPATETRAVPGCLRCGKVLPAKRTRPAIYCSRPCQVAALRAAQAVVA